MKKKKHTKSDSLGNSEKQNTLHSSFSTSYLNEDVVFVPSEDIRSIEYVLDKLKKAQKEFRKAAEELKISTEINNLSK
jgi:hypothetical protein